MLKPSVGVDLAVEKRRGACARQRWSRCIPVTPLVHSGFKGHDQHFSTRTLKHGKKMSNKLTDVFESRRNVARRTTLNAGILSEHHAIT